MPARWKNCAAKWPLCPRRNVRKSRLINKVLIEQRQAAALPFWGIAGLGLLLGIATFQPLDLIATVLGGAGAIAIQKAGWKLQAKRLALRTLEEIDGTRAPQNDMTST
jgi:hypothetical protein